MNRNASKLVVLNLEESVIAALAKLAPEASLPVAGKLVPSARHTMGKRQRAAIHAAPDSPPNRPAMAVALVSPPPVVTPPVLVAPAQLAPAAAVAPAVSSVTNGAAQ